MTKLEEELLICHALNIPRVYLHTHPEYKDKITLSQKNKINDLLNRRRQGEPLAYIIGSREFYSLLFTVTPDTLIPRPETELLVDIILDNPIYTKNSPVSLLELGTGSGAIAIAIGVHRPDWKIEAVDISKKALKIAQQNADNLKATIKFYSSDWFNNIKKKYHIIVSNPPYISAHDPHLTEGDLRFEPQTALVSGQDGLEAIKNIIQQARHYLIKQGIVALEHGYTQADSVQNILRQQGFVNIKTYKDLSGIPRVTVAETP